MPAYTWLSKCSSVFQGQMPPGETHSWNICLFMMLINTSKLFFCWGWLVYPWNGIYDGLVHFSLWENSQALFKMIYEHPERCLSPLSLFVLTVLPHRLNTPSQFSLCMACLDILISSTHPVMIPLYHNSGQYGERSSMGQ